MKSGTRKLLSIIPLGLQFVAMVSAISLISFIVPATQHVINEAEGKIQIPTPSQFMIENSGAAKILIFGLFAISAVTYFWTRKKMKEEADQLAIQSTVYGIVWYVGISVLGGMVMAGLLPYFALHSAPQ
tara:strand:+ start:321 stop:707 length:387 start_codon:yes stop_codon:yes gene_type:complete